MPEKITFSTLRDMALHEELDLDHTHVLRVPGGWIYSMMTDGDYLTPVFVAIPEEETRAGVDFSDLEEELDGE